MIAFTSSLSLDVTASCQQQSARVLCLNNRRPSPSSKSSPPHPTYTPTLRSGFFFACSAISHSLNSFNHRRYKDHAARSLPA